MTRKVSLDLLNRAYRAGELAQAIFYAIIEYTWPYDISNIRVVRNNHGELIMVEVVHGPGSKTGPQGASVCEPLAGGWLFKFPHESFKLADLFAKRALLADQNSIWAFVLMHNTVQLLFQDLVKNAQEDIKEVVHYLPIDARHVVQHSTPAGIPCARTDLPCPDQDDNGNLKGVYRIALTDGTKVALDLAGTQYNIPHVTVLPWAAYRERSASVIKYSLPFRSHHVKHNKNVSKNSTAKHLTIIKKQIESVNALLNESDLILGSDFKTMLSQDIEIFTDAKQRLLLAVSSRLAKHQQNVETEPIEPAIAPLDRIHDCPAMTNTSIGEPLLFHLWSMGKFDWQKLVDMVKVTGPEVTYREKKKAKALLQHRCVYRVPGNWRLIFIADEMPSSQVPSELVSENPFWLKRK